MNQHSPLTTRRPSLSGRAADVPKRVARGVPKTRTLAVTPFLDHNSALSPPPPSPSCNHRHHPNAGLSIDTFLPRRDRLAEEWTHQTLHALFDYSHDDHQTIASALSSLPSPTQSSPDSCSTPLSASTLSRSSTTSTTCTDDTNYSIQALSSGGREGDAPSPVRPTMTSAVLPRAMSAPLFTLHGSYIPEESSDATNPCHSSDLGATTVADLQTTMGPSFFVFDSPISTPTNSSPSTPDPFNTFENYALTWSTDSTRSLKRLHALHELLETERAYVRDLRVLVEIYLTPLLRLAWLSPSHARCLSRNAADLLRFHETFSAELEEARSRGERNVRRMSLDQREGIKAVAGCFMKAEPNFEIYTEYCVHHDTALAVANELKGKTEWVAFMKECAKEFQARTGQASRLHFTDYLIKPVQRICQYHLLLKELVRPTPDLALESSDLRAAAEAMRRVVARIDGAKSRREAEARTERFWDRVEEDGRFPRHFIRHLGPLVISGALSMVPRGTYPPKPKYYGCFVFPTHMIVVRARRAVCYEPRHWFQLGPCEIRILGEGEGFLPNAWILQSPDASFEFGASSPQERRLWVRYLRDTISLARPASAPSPLPALHAPGPIPHPSSSTPIPRPGSADSTVVARRDPLLPRPVSAPPRRANSMDLTDLFRREKVAGVVPPSRRASVDTWLEDVTTVECLAVRVWRGWGEEIGDTRKKEEGEGELGFLGEEVEPVIANRGGSGKDIKVDEVKDGTEARLVVERTDKEGTIVGETGLVKQEPVCENSADDMLSLVQKNANDHDEVNKLTCETVVSEQEPVLDRKPAESHQPPSAPTDNDTESIVLTVELIPTIQAPQDPDSSNLTIDFISTHLTASEIGSTLASDTPAPYSVLESRIKKSLLQNVFNRLTRLAKGRRGETRDNLVTEGPSYIAGSRFAKAQKHLVLKPYSSTPLPLRDTSAAPPPVNLPDFYARLPVTFDGPAPSQWPARVQAEQAGQLSLDLHLVRGHSLKEWRCRKAGGSLRDTNNEYKGSEEWWNQETAGSVVEVVCDQDWTNPPNSLTDATMDSAAEPRYALPAHVPITGVASSALRRGRQRAMSMISMRGVKIAVEEGWEGVWRFSSVEDSERKRKETERVKNE